ncbi:diacylglycerol kinase catalytic domain-containing protein [Kitasatospora azatica]|uniref:diacylglycerol kinase family protein n=1 Tax=Kitasatospora azatica TaxID=58347 RepID=UPI0007C640F3|nr:diacylglycerol kinase family protein [Kitasatospora azatica]
MSFQSTSVPPPADAPQPPGHTPLLVLLDPAAREADGEAVRIARDVLTGGADVKVVVPESAAELDRVLSHRGKRRPVVVGSDLALQRVVQALHQQSELGAVAVGLVPVGQGREVALARSLGVPVEPVAAARTVLAGTPRRLGLLLDDGDGVVLGEVRIPGRRHGHSGGWRSLWAKLITAEQVDPQGERLRVEADGRPLGGADRPLRLVALRLPAGSAAAEVVVRPCGPGGALLRARASSVTVAGRAFGYEADGCPAGPVPARTWTAHPAAWRLLLPAT